MRPWSRPVVALLYFLQPIVRGVARYQGRLAPPPTPLAVQQSLHSVALCQSNRSLDEVCYWSQEGMNRLTWVNAMLGAFEKHDWPHRPDIGWNEFDAEIYGSRWSTLRLVTVAEEHANGKKALCCRLNARWSLQARVVFWSLVAAELFVLGLVGGSARWLWFFLLTLPLLAWFLQRDQRSLQSVIIVFLDDLAKELQLIKITHEPITQPKTAPTTEPNQKSPFRPKPETTT